MESTSQEPGSDPPVEGKSSPSLTPTAAPASVAGIPTLMDEGITRAESTHDSDSAEHVKLHGQVASTHPFSYTVPPNANMNTENPHQSSSNTVMADSAGSSSFSTPPASGVPASPGPSFSYNIPQAEIASFRSNMVADSAWSEVPKNVSSSATPLQHPVPGQLASPNTFLQGAATQVRPPPSPVAVPREVSNLVLNCVMRAIAICSKSCCVMRVA